MRLTDEEAAVIRKMRDEKLAAELAWKPKDDHTDAEKIAAFDQLRKSALAMFEDVKKERRYADGDSKHYLYEEVMKLMLGKDVFNVMNKLTR